MVWIELSRNLSLTPVQITPLQIAGQIKKGETSGLRLFRYSMQKTQLVFAGWDNFKPGAIRVLDEMQAHAGVIKANAAHFLM